jgi:magnesium transporter
MLSTCRRGGALQAVGDPAAAVPADAVWLDLLNPSPQEVALVERTVGVKMPSHADLLEIEASSRLRVDDGALLMSMPLLYRPDASRAAMTPVGFVLTRDRLVTIRFAALAAFATFGEEAGALDPHEVSAVTIFAGLAEAIVDRLADVLETIANELDTLSQRLFRAGPLKGGASRRPGREEASLRVSLKQVGRSGDHASQIRDSLLGIARVVPFVAAHAADWSNAEIKARLETLRQDVGSLSDYDMHLTNKIQLLLDATLGLINIEQNNIIKVLTVVSVIGIPPTLVASLYGMNFKAMPELDWSWGYPYALVLMLLSAVLPVLWFKYRGWF